MLKKSEVRVMIKEMIKEETIAYGPDNLGHTKLNWYDKSLDDFIKDELGEDVMHEVLTSISFAIAGKAYKNDALKIAKQLIKDYRIRKFNNRAKDELVKQLKPKWEKGKTKVILNVDDILKQQELGTF